MNSQINQQLNQSPPRATSLHRHSLRGATVATPASSHHPCQGRGALLLAAAARKRNDKREQLERENIKGEDKREEEMEVEEVKI